MIYQYVPFINKGSKLLKKVKEIDKKMRPVKEDNIMNKDSRKYK